MTETWRTSSVQLEEVDILGLPVGLGKRASHGILLRRSDGRAYWRKGAGGVDASAEDLRSVDTILQKACLMYSQ